MADQAKQANWTAWTLIAAFVLLTLLAMVSWLQVVTGTFGSGRNFMRGAGSMTPVMMNSGMMSGAADGSSCNPAGSGASAEQMFDNCQKLMESNIDHDQMHRQMHGNGPMMENTL